ncbi:MAG: succinyldiaminopimelate transaminase [Chromatocurvus sp.]
MNRDLDRLHPYPFERLAALIADIKPPEALEPITLTIGEPRHEAPAAVIEALHSSLHLLDRYPATRGSADLRSAIADWLQQRFGIVRPDPGRQVLPVSGTREALFAIAQTCVSRVPGALVLSPNPFYQIYEGATLLAGADPVFMNCDASNSFLPDPDRIDAETWKHCQLLYLCTPGNPSGAVMSSSLLCRFIDKALEHNVVLVSDECYSEIYGDEDAPPPGLLQACEEAGNPTFRNCLSFHSLSKRSNLPGLRSGFVAGDATLLDAFTRYRNYHGCAMPLHHQAASAVAWRDEAHVVANRALYREKFTSVASILAPALPLQVPEAGFYLWPQTPIADTDFTQQLYAEENVLVLPGRFLARDSGGINPGENHVRMALVATLADCEEAARRITRFLGRL